MNVPTQPECSGLGQGKKAPGPWNLQPWIHTHIVGSGLLCLWFVAAVTGMTETISTQTHHVQTLHLRDKMLCFLVPA